MFALQEHAAGLPPSLTSFSGRFPACVGTQAPSPGPPVAVRHTLSAFPRAVPSNWARVVPHPQAHTLWRVRGCVARGGGASAVGGISPFFISLALIQTDVSFYFELPENRSFLSIVSLGRPPGEKSTE